MVREAQQKNWPNPSIARIEAHRHLWKRNWFLEFASDMVAAYCAGPAYGSSNVRLCMNLSADLLVTAPVAILLWGFAVRFNDFGMFHCAVGWVN